jgi:hypothetical protein
MITRGKPGRFNSTALMVPGTKRPCRFISYRFHLCKSRNEKPQTHPLLLFCARLLPGPSIPRGGLPCATRGKRLPRGLPHPTPKLFSRPFALFPSEGCKPGSRGGNPAPQGGGMQVPVHDFPKQPKHLYLSGSSAKAKKKKLKIASDPVRPVASSHTLFLPSLAGHEACPAKRPG